PVPLPTTYNEGDVERPILPGGDDEAVLRGLTIQPLADPPMGALSVDDQISFGRGSYLVNAVADCTDCHTNPFRVLTIGSTFLHINPDQYLSGGSVWLVPPGLDALFGQVRTMTANLTGETHGLTDDFGVFLGVITEGKHVDDPGQPLLGFPMPWL